MLQFKGHSFEQKTTTSAGWTSEEQNRGHHTAIVEQDLGDGRLIVLEQHVRPAGEKEVSKKVQWREIFVKNGATIKEGGAVKRSRPKARSRLTGRSLPSSVQGARGQARAITSASQEIVAAARHPEELASDHEEPLLL